MTVWLMRYLDFINSLTIPELPMYIVTGASSGIGQATALALAQNNCQVLAVARSVKPLIEIAQRYPSLVIACCADLASERGVEQVLSAIKSKPLAGIVHAAGSSIALAAYNNLAERALLDHMAVHVIAPITLHKKLGEQLFDARVVFIDSYSANAPRIGWASYSIVKAAAQMAARSAAAELTRSTVVRVYPGAVRTPLVEAVLSSSTQSPTVKLFRELEASGKITSATEIGNFIANILSNATLEALAQREVWDYNNPHDRIFDD